MQAMRRYHPTWTLLAGVMWPGLWALDIGWWVAWCWHCYLRWKRPFWAPQAAQPRANPGDDDQGAPARVSTFEPQVKQITGRRVLAGSLNVALLCICLLFLLVVINLGREQVQPAGPRGLWTMVRNPGPVLCGSANLSAASVRRPIHRTHYCRGVDSLERNIGARKPGGPNIGRDRTKPRKYRTVRRFLRNQPSAAFRTISFHSLSAASPRRARSAIGPLCT